MSDWKLSNFKASYIEQTFIEYLSFQGWILEVSTEKAVWILQMLDYWQQSGKLSWAFSFIKYCQASNKLEYIRRKGLPQYGVVQASLPVKRLFSNFYFLLFLIFAFEAPNQARLTHTANCKLETRTEMHAGLRLLIKVLLKSVVCILPWIAVCSPQSSFYTDQLRSQYFLSDISIN